MTHTPGPWVYDSNWGVVFGTPMYVEREQVEEGGDYEGCPINEIHQVCTLNNMRVYPYSKNFKDYPVREDVEDRVYAKREADARLIVAAPDLVAALNSIAHTFVEDSHGGTKTLPAHEYQKMAREALRKAGQS